MLVRPTKNSLAAALAIVFSLAAAGCERKDALLTDTVAPPAAETGCNAEVISDWAARESLRFSVEARTLGESCANAVAVLVVRSADGAPQLAVAQPATHTFGLSLARTASDMRLALREWVRQDAGARLTSELPAWPDNAEGPGPGQEFPFMPEDWLDRAAYEALRAENAPLFSYPQGMESQAVLMLKDGRLERIGVQLFPG